MSQAATANDIFKPGPSPTPQPNCEEALWFELWLLSDTAGGHLSENGPDEEHTTGEKKHHVG